MNASIAMRGGRVVVKVAPGTETTQLGMMLRTSLSPIEVLPVAGGFSLPNESIAVLARILPLETNAWPPDLAARVERLRSTMSRQVAARAAVDIAIRSPYEQLAGYGRIDKLDEHQVQAVAAMTVPTLEGLALFDEQGTGKTYCGLATFDVLKQKQIVTSLLVIAPKSVLPAWRKDAGAFWGDEYSVETLLGAQVDHQSILRRAADVYLVSYGAAGKLRIMLRALATSKNRRLMLVVDESFYVKNPNAARSKAVAQIREFCARAYVLCGTPAPNSPVDIVNQIDIADAGVTFGSATVPSDPNSAMGTIQAAMGRSAIYLRRLKEEVLPELPGKRIDKVVVNLAPEQSALYEEAKTALVMDVRRIDDSYFQKHLGAFLARKWTLLQICSNPGALDPLYSGQIAKLEALDRIVSQLVKTEGRKLVIWSFFKYSLAEITRRYASLGLVSIDGSVASVDVRGASVERFQHDPSIRLFVGSPAAAGAGITLTAASHAVFESFSNQPAHYLQSVDRIHRRGQAMPVTSIVLLAGGTIEETEFGRLVDKERRGHELFSESPRPIVTREGFLKDLLGE